MFMEILKGVVVGRENRFRFLQSKCQPSFAGDLARDAEFGLHNAT
jgi:hypothetical protein